MKDCLKIISALLLFLSIVILLEAEAFGSILADPNVPDGEQYIWRATMPDEEPYSSVVTWRVTSGEGRPMYVITTDSGERKYGDYVIDKSDLRLIGVNVTEKTRDGKFEIAIAARNGRQYMVSEFKNKTKQKDIKHISDGYNGIVLPFCLRGFPFGEKKEVKLRITVPIIPGRKLWVWKMWKSTVKLVGEETITVPAGTFDCYKLKVSASNWVIKRVTSRYYFWYTKEPPHRFVKFQDKDGKNMTELMEILFTGEE